MAEYTAPVVKIRVRPGASGDSTVRDISLVIPAGIDPMELRDKGLAVNGNEATFSVGWHPYNGEYGLFDSPFGSRSTLDLALAQAEQALVTYLRKRGFEPQFA